ncbi:MAG TPA: hypothetical protein VEI57_10095 [Nitrospirota bacterium]|nr:hypothetical protein [Nitrospirota bacterium]
MARRLALSANHPLRKLFRRALDFGFRENPADKTGVENYLEEQILCEFIRTENLYKIKDAAGKPLEDVADLLSEGDVRLNASSFPREFEVHKHIGDYTLFMLGMFPMALSRRSGKEFILGRIIIPGSALYEHYLLQGRRSYSLASQFTDRDLYLELSTNFLLYRNVLELVRIYLETAKSSDYLNAKRVITEME